MASTSHTYINVPKRQLARSGKVMLYVLIVVSVVNSGQVVTMQEFTSEKNCMVALDSVKSNSRWAAFVYATCVQK
jgi:hypothetical protein